MKPFTYRTAASEAEAVQALGGKAVALAGGTSLLNLMKERVIEPDVVVNLKTIPGFDTIDGEGTAVRFGAGVTLTEMLAQLGIKALFPALAQALETVGTLQIRNQATLGGNLCAKTPCAYFQKDGFACLKRGNGNSCPAKEGDHEFHAIFGTVMPCVSVHASSLAPALIALGGKVRIAGPGGAREVPIDDFFVLAKEDPSRENVLKSNEIVTHVSVNANPKSGTYVSLQKASHDWPTAMASAALEMQGDTVKSARICLGAVAPIPWRAQAAEAVLAGKKVTPETASAAADAAMAGAAPLPNNGYKVKVAHTALKRAVLLAATGKWR